MDQFCHLKNMLAIEIVVGPTGQLSILSTLHLDVHASGQKQKYVHHNHCSCMWVPSLVVYTPHLHLWCANMGLCDRSIEVKVVTWTYFLLSTINLLGIRYQNRFPFLYHLSVWLVFRKYSELKTWNEYSSSFMGNIRFCGTGLDSIVSSLVAHGLISYLLCYCLLLFV